MGNNNKKGLLKIECFDFKYLLKNGIDIRPENFDFIYGYPSLNNLIKVNQNVDTNEYIKTDEKIGIYIHIPFCSKICSFCYFTTYKNNDEELISAYLDAVKNELRLYAIENPNKKISYCYFGGGTPTTLTAAQLKSLIKYVYLLFDISDDFEFTCEASPETIDENKLFVLKETGITRLSIGIQSFHEPIMRMMNRAHNFIMAIDSINLAKKYFNNNYNIDLIYGFSGGSLKILSEDLEYCNSLNIPSITMYQIWLRVNTKFSSEITNVSVKNLLKQKILIHEYLNKIGYYRDKSDWFIKNNQAKFRFQDHKWSNKAFWGIGVGSYAYVNNIYYRNLTNIKQYIKSINENKISIGVHKRLSMDEQITRTIMLGIKMEQGVNSNIGHFIEDNNEKREIDRKFKVLLKLGLAKIEQNRIKLTNKGFFISDNISEFFLNEEDKELYEQLKKY